MKKPDVNTFGGRLSLLMKRQGFRNLDVAAFADVHATTVSKWRNDVFPPEEEQLVRVASALGVSAQWLRYGGDELASLREQLSAAQADREAQWFCETCNVPRPVRRDLNQSEAYDVACTHCGLILATLYPIPPMPLEARTDGQ